MEAPHWTETEFADLDLGDARLNKRARTLMERMAAKPTVGVPQACRGWSETMAAYRFFDNEEVGWSAILEPHWQQTEQRMAAQPIVLCLQDTTELDFNGRQATGLGPLSYEAQRGMYLHPTYAVTPERVPLGVLDAWMWAREPREPLINEVGEWNRESCHLGFSDCGRDAPIQHGFSLLSHLSWRALRAQDAMLPGLASNCLLASTR
ncbi:hypothetical protein LBW59_12765, partial [Ralstonia solanacearum]